jgi:mgtE-like transporter
VKTPTPDRFRRAPFVTRRTTSPARTPEEIRARRRERALRLALPPARAALGVARAPAIVVRRPALAVFEIVRYWRAERKTLRQGIVALTISAVGNIPTGLALGFMSDRLELLPGLFILVPAAIGMRGNIFGALGSRLGTSIHAGLFRVSRDRRGVLAQNVYASLLLTFTTSLLIAVVARAVAAATGLRSISVWDFLAISILAGVGSSVFILALTVLLAREGYKRNWDLDAVAAPLITFMGDVITMPTLFLASYVALRGHATLAIGALSGVVCLWAAVQGFRTRLPTARRIIRESIITLFLAGFVDIIAGTVVEHRARRFFALPALLVMLPPFLENAGALGGIVSSRLASRLHLGAIRPRWVPERLAALDISMAGPWSILNFGLTGVTAHYVALALNFSSPGLGKMVGIAMVAGAFATLGAALIAYTTAIATFRFNLDPDNHGIPAVTSSMDLIGVICVIGTIVLFGVT